MHRHRAVARRACRIASLAGLAGVAVLVAASAVQAQSASSTLSAFKAGYGGTGLSGFEQPVNVNTRDANGNLVITDGVIQAGSDNSVFSHVMVGGASDTFSGAGALGSATAIGNNLSVNVSGNYNTVVVNSNQTNTGSISATTTLNGKVNLDGGQ
ncbi:holdfast anchoring protein HfaA [Caulobacter sp. S45]|jgi:holdfast attachment protein HfaA|uniref:holdfast anchoring protein HfaA n=1 Tax=Caulobacter sp. S45 TaxID=1641861 RepID=UPI00131D4E2A|nr:holdfast anchoring protein HfaA [Caulobacter sp. S45]